jgi:hypothetical protein
MAMTDIDAHDVFLQMRDVRKRYGGVSHMFIERKLRDPDSDFPKPVYIGRRRFWSLLQLVQYERKCAKAPKPSPTARQDRRKSIAQ